MKITSPEFEYNGLIPSKFTCRGTDVNPPLIIEDVPPDTVSMALIMDDPDAPMGTWVHWVVYDMPVTGEIGEDTVPGKQGINDFGRISYGGPCPPSGTHRYSFRVYALDTELGLEEGAEKRKLEKVMKGHILASAELVGLFGR